SDVYELGIEAAGFAATRISAVRVDPAKDTTVPPIWLEVSSTTQTVEVTASPTSVQVTKPEISSTITAAQLQGLPVLDRQVTVPLITQAGITGDRTSTSIN